MFMKRIDMTPDMHVIIGLATDVEYIKAIKDDFNFDYLESPSYKKFAKWCIEWFEEYDEAPGENLTLIYEQKKREAFQKQKGSVEQKIKEYEDALEKPNLSDWEAVHLTDRLDYLKNDSKACPWEVEFEGYRLALNKINNYFVKKGSEEEKSGKTPFKTEYLINMTIRYFREQEATISAKRVLDAYEASKPERAMEIIKETSEKLFGENSLLAGTKRKYRTDMFDVLTTVEDLIEKKIPEPFVILDPWLTDGSVTEFYGERGVGKTWLTMALAVAVSRKDAKRTKMGPWEVKNTTGVLYIDGEMPQKALQDRYETLQEMYPGDPDPKLKLEIWSASQYGMEKHKSITLGDAIYREDIFQWFVDNTNCQLLILDNIAILTHGLDEDSKNDWDPVNEWLVRLRHIGVATIFVHHSGKSGEQRGTSGREDNVDCVFRLMRPKDYRTGIDGAYFNIRNEKARLIGPDKRISEFSLRLDENPDGRNVWRRGEPYKALTDKQEIIIGLLLDGKINQKEIARAADCSGSNVTQAKRKAVGLGYMEEDGSGTRRGYNFLKGLKEDRVLRVAYQFLDSDK